MGVEQRGIEVLGTLLAELGWSPSRLADASTGSSGLVTWRGTFVTRVSPRGFHAAADEARALLDTPARWTTPAAVPGLGLAY